MSICLDIAHRLGAHRGRRPRPTLRTARRASRSRDGRASAYRKRSHRRSQRARPGLRRPRLEAQPRLSRVSAGERDAWDFCIGTCPTFVRTGKVWFGTKISRSPVSAGRTGLSIKAGFPRRDQIVCNDFMISANRIPFLPPSRHLARKRP
jgi:hypothetical protein